MAGEPEGWNDETAVPVSDREYLAAFACCFAGDGQPSLFRLVELIRVGLPDRYVTHGKPALLREEVGLTGESVADRVLEALRVTAAVPR